MHRLSKIKTTALWRCVQAEKNEWDFSNAVLVESGTINRCALAPDTLRLRNGVTRTDNQVPDRYQLSAARGLLPAAGAVQAPSTRSTGFGHLSGSTLWPSSVQASYTAFMSAARVNRHFLRNGGTAPFKRSGTRSQKPTVP
jgi:hypothetical protein